MTSNEKAEKKRLRQLLARCATKRDEAQQAARELLYIADGAPFQEVPVRIKIVWERYPWLNEDLAETNDSAATREE